MISNICEFCKIEDDTEIYIFEEESGDFSYEYKVALCIECKDLIKRIHDFSPGWLSNRIGKGLK